jgi:hypothetical protein
MSTRAAIVAGFAVIFVLMISVEVAARRERAGVRPLGAALTAALRTPAGRFAVLGAWLWFGWHFLAR